MMNRDAADELIPEVGAPGQYAVGAVNAPQKESFDGDPTAFAAQIQAAVSALWPYRSTPFRPSGGLAPVMFGGFWFFWSKTWMG